MKQKAYSVKLGDNIVGIDQFEKIFDNLSDIYVWIKDIDGRFVMANQLFIEKCGQIDENSVVGKTDFDFFPRDRASHYVQDDRVVLQTGKPILDRVELAPESEISLNHFVTSKFPLLDIDGNSIGTMGIARDLEKSRNRINPFNEMASVIKYIHTRYSEQIKVEKLAKIASMSVSLFERRFRDLFQISPRQYIIDIRLTSACKKIINSRENLSYIAQECGFYDHSHFTRSFHNKFGITPKEYRDIHR